MTSDERQDADRAGASRSLKLCGRDLSAAVVSVDRRVFDGQPLADVFAAWHAPGIEETAGLGRSFMLIRFDPYRELDRLTEQLASTAARAPRAFPMDAYRRGEQFISSSTFRASAPRPSI